MTHFRRECDPDGHTNWCAIRHQLVLVLSLFCDKISALCCCRGFGARSLTKTTRRSPSMTRKCFLLTIVFCVSVSMLARASDEIVPAGTLLQCTVSDPNFSSKT